MDLLGNFLGKYSKFINKTILLKEVVIDVIYNKFNITLTRDDIIYYEGVITIRKSPIIKMEILLHQKELILSIKEKLPTTNIIKIV